MNVTYLYLVIPFALLIKQIQEIILLVVGS